MQEPLKTYSLYRIEYELIKSVKKLRKEKGWSQEVLSKKMGLNKTFVSNCESLDEEQKYNLRHLGILKKIFDFKSLDNFFPNGIPKDEKIIIKYKKEPKKKTDGSDSKLMTNIVVEIVVDK